MAKRLNVCVVGATTVVGETLLELLEARSFPVGNLFLVDTANLDANPISFKGEDYPVHALEDFDFARCELAFFCVERALAQEYVPKAVDAGTIVIDDSDAFRGDETIPLVVPEVNAEAIAAYRERRIIASPNSCATIIAVSLKPIQDALGVKKVNAVTFQSVSGVGRAGIDELAEQAMALFNQKPLESRIFPKQVAFNLIPRIGTRGTDGSTQEEAKIANELKRLLRNSDMSVEVTAVRVPVFYGHSMALHVETRDSAEIDQVVELMENAPGVTVYDMAEGDGCPTPMAEAAANDPVFVGRIRLAHDGKGVNLWSVADNTRKGSSLNLVQIAEILVEKYLG